MSELLSVRWKVLEETSPESYGQKMYALIARLFPIYRSITGEGVRQTLRILGEYIPLETIEIDSGTPVFDWVVPPEWNIRDAYILDPAGKKIVDLQRNNLHILGYSTPVRAKLSLDELKSHLHTLPDQPDLIPYLTSYYERRWGFCISHHQYAMMEEGEYEVVIDSILEDGTLTYGEYLLKGESESEVLISCYTCHPSMCNDNLSGVALATLLAQALTGLPLCYSYRFLFIPETIGAITWLARNESTVPRIRHGLVATCLGDSGHLTYKKSRRGNAVIDRAAQHTLQHSGAEYEVLDFFPSGSDERQFCSPGFNLPVGVLMRTPYNRFPEYHTSGDNLDLVKPDKLADTFAMYRDIIRVLENNHTYLSLNPKGEPHLGKRGLYQTLGGQKSRSEVQAALRWVLNYSDGEHDLLSIAEKANLPFPVIYNAAELLIQHDLLRRIESPPA